MISKLSLAVLLTASVYGGNLTFESGIIKAHTEVFGDKTIDPFTKKAVSHLTIEDAPATLRGTIEIGVNTLISDNRKRDEHMQEALESSVFPKAVFEVKEVIPKGEGSYTLKGIMNLHGVSKAMSFEGTIAEEEGKVHIKAATAMKMSDFGIKPPKMMFLTVRDQVDLSVDVSLKR